MILAPLLSSATPADDTSAVAVDSNIVLTFSENVAFGSGSITISDGYTQTYLDKGGLLQTRWVGATDTRVLSINDPQVSISGNTVTIDLNQDLKSGLTYNVTVSKGFFQDSNSVPFAGIAGSGKLNFTTVGTVAAPTAHIGAAIQFNDTGISNTDYITNSASVQGTYSGTLGAHDMVQVSLDNGASWHIASAANGSWSYNGTPGLEGASTVIARVANTVGQSSGSTSHGYVFDDVGPTVSSASLDNTALGLNDTATVTITFSEAVSSFTVVNSTINSATYGSFSSTDGLHWTATVTPNANTNNNSVQDSLEVNATDVAGNPLQNSLITIAQYSVTTTGLPAVNLAITALSNDSGSANNDFITSSASQTISGTLDGTLPNGVSVQISVDGVNWLPAGVNNSNHTWSVSNVTLQSGTHSLQARLTDGVNFGSPTEHSYTVDTQAPVLQSSTLGASSIVLSFNENVIVNNNTVFTLTDSSGNVMQIGVGNSLVSVNGSDVTLSLPAALSNNTHYSLDMTGGSVSDLAGNAGYANSAHVLDLATDGSGNLQMASHIIASATSAFNATSTSVTGQYYSLNGTDHVQIYDGSNWTTVSDAAVSGNIHSWSATIGLLTSVVQLRLVDSNGNAVQYLNEGGTDLYFGASGAGSITTPDHSIVFGGSGINAIHAGDHAYVTTGSGTNSIHAGDYANITTSTGSNSIQAGDYAQISSNGFDGVVVGDHATVSMAGGGSTLSSAGDYLNLTTSGASHSIVLSHLDANSSITANGSNDTLNFNFSSTTSLHDLVNTYHMTGVEILNLMLGSNDLTIGSAADVTAFAGGNTLYVAGNLATSIHIDNTQWNTGIVGVNYTEYDAKSNGNIHLFVLNGMGQTQ